MRAVVVIVGLAAGCGRLNFDSDDSPPDDGGDPVDGMSSLAITAPIEDAEVGPRAQLEGACLVGGGAVEVAGTGVDGAHSATCVASAFEISVGLTPGFGAKQVIVSQSGASVTRNLQRVPQRPLPFTARSGTTVSAGGATNCDLSIDLPPGVSPGQLIVGMIYSDGGSGPSISTPGFTRLSLDSGVAVAFFKVAGFTEPATYKFTIVAGTANSDTCASGGVLVGIKNVDPVSPIEDDTVIFNFGTSLAAPGVVSTFPTTIVGVFGSNGPGTGIAVPNGMTTDASAMPNGSFAISPDGAGNALISWQEVDAGATGIRATSISTARNTAAGLIALRPL